MSEASLSYADLFKLEIDSWCHSISTFPGEINDILVFAAIKELTPSFRQAIKAGIVLDVKDIAGRFAKGAKYLVDEFDIIFKILAQLPSPNQLNEDEQYILAATIERIEQVYPGTLEALEAKWRGKSRVILRDDD
jgi:hypothetical protein